MKASDEENKGLETDKVSEKKPSFKETVKLISQGKAKEKLKVQLSKDYKSGTKSGKEMETEIKPIEKEYLGSKTSEEEPPEITSKEEIQEAKTLEKEKPGTLPRKEEKPDEIKTVKISKKDKKLKTKEISEKETKRELTSPDTLKTPPAIENENMVNTEKVSSEPTITKEEIPINLETTPDFKDKLETRPDEIIETEVMVEHVEPAKNEVLINPGFEREDNIFLSSENADFKDREKKLYDKGLYHLIRRFVRKSKYEYLDNFVRKSRYDYQFVDLQKLKDLLVYKGIEFTDEEIRFLIQEEVKKQEYQEFEDKIITTEPKIPTKILG